ncbi:MAG TPA: SWIM zinc finger family protein [Longimicrobium sp.]|jgi:hypothetical protein
MTRSMIDIPRAGGVDLGRLERGIGLQVTEVGPGRYAVRGGSEPHWVDLRTPNQPRCDCGDHLWRERVCKHILAALLREGDERVIHAVAQLVLSLRSAAAPTRRAA